MIPMEKMSFEAAYIKLHREGALAQKIEVLNQLLQSCTLCPRQCRVNRMKDERGYCRAGKDLYISSAFPHFGEEPPLVGHSGSGTIFLTYCNLLCLFCQNYDISHLGHGQKISLEQMANSMVQLQEAGCHNINFVTPTHFVPQIISALPLAIERGLRIPVVYNCSGYESLEVIRSLDGIVDIYMPDAKFSQGEPAGKYCQAQDYPLILKQVLKEMHRQVGDLNINKVGIAERGLLIRHLVMPNQVAGTEELMNFIAKEISPDSYVNIMPQYRPCYKAMKFEEINRRIRTDEGSEAIELALKARLVRGFGV